MNFASVDRALEKMIGNGMFQVPGLGAIVYRDGVEIYSKFLGVRNVDRNQPVERQTRFRAASVSKMFTIFSIMKLVERGEIDLDDDISRRLGFKFRNPFQPSKPITIRMLADHTSSLRDETIFAPASEPVGEFFTYCNLNYVVLGTIIERVTGERFDRYQRQNILSELNTQAEYLPSNFDPIEFERLGTIYRKKNPRGEWFPTVDDHCGVRPKIDLSEYRIGSDAKIFAPQGGLRISFEELTHALEMLINGGEFRGRRVLSRQSIETITTPQWIFDPIEKNGDTYDGVMLAYGLGVYMIDGSSSARVSEKFSIDLIGHTGVAYGLLSGLFFEPNTRNGFVYMLNGLALDEENDPRARGKFSGNYVWEEKIMSALVRLLR